MKERATNYLRLHKRRKPSKEANQISRKDKCFEGKRMGAAYISENRSRLFSLHAETFEEAQREEREANQMNSVLRAKNLKPKSYIPQVILKENANHKRQLAVRLDEIDRRHQAALKKAKQRQEEFIESLERKQQEWKRKDEITLARMESERICKTFTFGGIRIKSDYPCYSVNAKVGTRKLPIRAFDYTRTRPTILPPVKHRSVFGDMGSNDKTRNIKLPKLQIKGQPSILLSYQSQC